MGSVFKPVLAAAALEQGILPEYECTGAVVVDGQIFRCAGGVPHGTVDLTAALEKSCNGYFIRLGQQLGAETLLQMSRQLGFGQEVPVGRCAARRCRKAASAGELAQSGQLANFSFGQGGLLASPVQIAAMMNTIASGGVYRTPFFVCGSVDETDGTPLETLAHPQSRRVMSAENAAFLRKMLQQVVEEAPHRMLPGWKKGLAARPVPRRPGSSHRMARNAKTCGSQGFTRRSSRATPLWCCRTAGEHGTFQRRHLCPAVRNAGPSGIKMHGFCLLFCACYATIYLYFCVVFVELK